MISDIIYWKESIRGTDTDQSREDSDVGVESKKVGYLKLLIYSKRFGIAASAKKL